MHLIKWDIYEVRTINTPINGVMFRGRIRKFCLKYKRNVLVENTQDVQKSVRFAIPHGENLEVIEKYIRKLVPDVLIELVMSNIPNPVLSKLKVNLEDRYAL